MKSSLFRRFEKNVAPIVCGNRSPDGEFEAKNFFQSFSLGEVLRQGTPVKVFKGKAENAPPDGGPTVFAIKRVRKLLLKNSKKQELFREVKILQELDHPNVVKIHKFFRSDPAYYYAVLDLVAGEELVDYIAKKESYSEADARGVCRVLVDVASYIHGKGIVHRDLNSHNILVAADGKGISRSSSFQLKITDFSKACSVQGGPVETTDQAVPADLSPEVHLGIPHATSVDMWSLGLIAFTILSGKHPFFRKGDMAKMALRIVAGDFEFRPEDWTNISEHARDFVTRLLMVDAQARMSAKEATTHPWLLATEISLEAHDLRCGLMELKILNAKSKLRSAVKTYFAARTMLAGLASPPCDFLRDYALGRQLGEGAYGTVFEATAITAAGHFASSQVVDDREGESRLAPKSFAVKRIEKQHDHWDTFVHHEVRIMRHLSHEHIVSIYDFYEDDPQHFYMVLELMKGGELLHSTQEKQRYDEAEARDASYILLNALKYTHDQDIVHRDLKPANLLLADPDDDTSIRLADFGMAESVRSGPLTESCGTPYFMAPEIWDRRPYGKAVDMWSVGVIVYILLGGYPPFRHMNRRLLGAKIKSGRFKFHKKAWKNVSPEAKDLISKLLNKDPATRLTASEACLHPWLSVPRAALSAHNLSANLEELRLYNAKRKFRAVVKTVMATSKLARGLDVQQT